MPNIELEGHGGFSTVKETIHISVDLSYYEHILNNTGKGLKWADVKDDFKEKETGRQATLEEAKQAIKDLRDKGYKVVPPCDNINPDGTCKGHPVKET